MKQQPDWKKVRQSYRANAEGLVSDIAPTADAGRPAEILLHELLVTKIEFEAQIEEFKRTHTELEEARDRLEDLYNSSPVGHVTISRECLVTAVNLTAAAWLGIDRKMLVNRRFSKFVSPHDRDRWDRLFVGLMEDSRAERTSFVVELVRADASTFCVYVDGQRRNAVNSSPTMHLALIDIGRIRRAEEERRAAFGASGPS